jgi:hypothetical protein
MVRGVSRRLSRRRRRLENFNFFLSVGGGGWKIFVLGGGGWKFFGCRRQRPKFFTDLSKTFLNFEKFSHKKSKE